MNGEFLFKNKIWITTMSDDHTQLEPDILDCDVNWALGRITMNKASGADEIPVEPF